MNKSETCSGDVEVSNFWRPMQECRGHKMSWNMELGWKHFPQKIAQSFAFCCARYLPRTYVTETLDFHLKSREMVQGAKATQIL